MKSKILLLLGISLLLAGCGEDVDRVNEIYLKGKIQGWNEAIEKSKGIDYFDFIGNIQEIPYDLKGCAVSHYIENYAQQPQRTIGYYFKDNVLYDQEGMQIDCEKYR